MTKIFSINGKTYTAKDFTFNLLCDLEESGLSLDDMEKKPMSLIRAYFAICAGISREQAALLIQKHLIDGGKLDDITDPMAKEMNDSDFFRAISENKDEEVTDVPSKARKKESNEESEDTSQLRFG